MMKMKTSSSCISKILQIAWAMALVTGAFADETNMTITSDLILEVNPGDWLKECLPVFHDTCCANNFIYTNYSQYDLKDKPSALCLPSFTCAWEGCLPTNYPRSFFAGALPFIEDFLSMDIDDSTTVEDIDQTFPGLSLPSMISFPKKASDIVEAIEYATEEGMKVSIMATGHSYTGASAAGGTVQLNMRDYPKYAANSITECASISDDPDHPDFTACKLALARGKQALMRVGGGERFNDAAGSVYAYKDEATGYAKYQMLHGGAGTVGAAGGWLQGGGLGWGQERGWGLGVDQVLEMELVLADGRHVKLQPTEWEDVEGYIYPKTTKVEGLCNTNVFADDESEWIWEPCEDPAPPFADLWFAVRGGGGGTYGVLTSLKYQLHDNIPFYILASNPANSGAFFAGLIATYSLDEEQSAEVLSTVAYCNMKYSLDFLFNPEKVNVTTDVSNRCGNPSLSVTAPEMFCQGEDAVKAAADTWASTMEWCTDLLLPSYSDYFSQVNFTDLFAVLGPFDTILGFNMDAYGRMGDGPPSVVPGKWPNTGWASAQIPTAWLASDDDETLFEIFISNGVKCEHVVGGNVGIAHDQMTAVPEIERQSGCSSASLAHVSLDLEEKLLNEFGSLWETETSNFPGMSEYNHLTIGEFGPLKADPTKLCPPDLPTEEKEKQCLSMQEAVWGVDLAEKLSKIKSAVDPDHLFYCYGCIQPYVDSPSPPSTPADPPADDTSSSAPVISSLHTSILLAAGIVLFVF